MKKLTFQFICKKLADKPAFSDSAEELKTLVGASALLLGDAAVGKPVTFIKALAEKDKLIDFGQIVLNKILAQKPADYSGRVDQMKEAYGTICFTAFFDELDSQLPDDIRQTLQLTLQEKKNLFQYPVSIGNSEHSERQEIVFPDLVYGSIAVNTHLERMYCAMADRLQDFVRNLSFQDTAGEKNLRIFDEVIKRLPKASIQRFHDQFLILCDKFNEFYIFAQMESEKEHEIKLEERYQAILSAALRVQNSSEAGLADLKEVILKLPDRIKEKKVREIAGELVRKYQNNIERPLIETKDNDEKLQYPPISEAFIPQAYKLLMYTGKERLEQPETWKPLEPQQDMMSFWAKYCLDPNSVENLLLVLGEPGGGKSLLTEILCARMIAPTSIFVRIPLRKYDMEDEIESIVCDRIEKDGDASESIQKFKLFSEQFPDNPVTLIFDGYDEVLQATGGVYRNLLRRIQRFQDHCREQRRPVRVIITSRETLIDKADIPKGTSVMKLLEFDDLRKKQWIDIWNEYNHEALTNSGLDDFSLPEKDKDIDELSGQPLLLMMLAIYDANFEMGTNALKRENDQRESLNRTKLYDELLRRFIRRELRKGPRGEELSFEDADENEQDSMVDEEMKKLGIAALGMFVREKLSLKVGELDDDLKYMKAKTVDYGNQHKKSLKNAERIFGSFFFIHDSRSENENDEDEKEASFEFLHKTFYEFLVADLILQYLIDSVDDLNDRKSNKKRGEAYYWEALDKPDMFDEAYYASLNGACLCMEPEIIQMMADWKDRKINNYFHGQRSDFNQVIEQVVEDLFNKHAAMIRIGIFAPSTWGNGGLASGKPYPQASAVYLMNLLILQIIVKGECRIKISEWDFISQFLKLNAPLPKKDKLQALEIKPSRQLKINPYEEIVLKFMALFQLQRDGEDVLLSKKTQVNEFEQKNLLEARMDVFNFMQDDVTWKLYQLHDVGSSPQLKQKHRVDLCKQGINLNFDLVMFQLHEAILHSTSDYHELEEIIHAGVREIGYQRDAALVLDWLLCIQILISKTTQFVLPRYITHGIFSDFDMLADIIFQRYINQEKIVLVFLEILKKCNCVRILTENPNILEKLFHSFSVSSDLIIAIAECIPLQRRIERNQVLHYSSNDTTDQIIDNIISRDSPKEIAALLKYLYLASIISSSHPVWDEIQRNWDRYLWKSPVELLELLQMYLQLGKFKEVKGFLRNTEKKGGRLRLPPEAVIGFLNIAEAVGEDLRFSEFVVRHFDMGSGAIERYPHVFMKLLLYAVSNRSSQLDVNYYMHIFLQHYNIPFHYDAEEAVYILYRIQDYRDFENQEWIPKACAYSLEYYNLLLEKSIKAAARLMILYQRMPEPEKMEAVGRIHEFFEDAIHKDEPAAFPVFCAERCFDKAISNHDRTDISVLMEFLDSMDISTKADLVGYFKGRYPYLKMYSAKLARKVADIYQLS